MIQHSYKGKKKDDKKGNMKKKSKFKINNNSPYHNFQKHLTLALKKLINFDNEDDQNIPEK